MASIIEALDQLPSKGCWKEWQNPAWKGFVQSGDQKALRRLPNMRESRWLPREVMAAIPPPSKIGDGEKRFLQACVFSGLCSAIGEWILRSTLKETGNDSEFPGACRIARELGCSEEDLAVQIAAYLPLTGPPDGRPTSAGSYLLSLKDPVLDLLVEAIANSNQVRGVAGLFMSHARKRWRDVLDRLNSRGAAKRLDSDVWLLALSTAPEEFLEPAARGYELAENWNSRFAIGIKLFEIEPRRFEESMTKLAMDQLLAKDSNAAYKLWHEAQVSAFWLLEHHQNEAFPALENYFAAELDSRDWQRKSQGGYKKEVLDKAVALLGRDALPLIDACFMTDQSDVQLRALQQLSGLRTNGDTAAIVAKLRALLSSKDNSVVARATRLAGDLVPEATEEELWALLAHKSRPVRDAAAFTVAKLGNSRLAKAEELWKAKRADTRLAGVAWLKELNSPEAAAELNKHLEEEEVEDVRDAILLALEAMEGSEVAANPAEIRARVKRTMARISGSPVSWLEPGKLPSAKLKDGSKLSADSLLYLLYRQSRVKDIRPDIEARPLYAQIDRKTSGDLALAVLQAFFGSEADADDRWAMAFAAILGDDRLVPVINRQIKQWADNMRGKLAEYAVQALALLGSDSALLAVDAMAIRYRSKYKNIGKAATEAFAAAARDRGLTVEELGDLVVPWLGFEPGEPRLISAGKATIEARIGHDFKLSFRDVGSNKKVAKLPSGVSNQIKAEFKEVTTGLKEAVKSQLLRMETLMVRQFHWPAPRWKELFLNHPLLLPFSQRLVWGVYDRNGKLDGTFRALEDRSLTSAEDETIELADQNGVGVVHPLELPEETRGAWTRHLADYDIVPPFAQLERSVVTVSEQLADTRIGTEVAETELNGLTFKGRAERLGWARGSVCDAGCINYYLKSFPAAGVDVFVETEGMYVGIDMYTDIKLGRIFFVRHGSVQIGSYVYDEPGDPNDPRLVRYADVPVIAYSEAMGDLAKIAGKGNVEAGKGADV